jgi:hypothetical protein
MGNTNHIYVEMLYSGEEMYYSTPHTSDSVHQMFPHIAEASNNGVKAYDVNIPHRALAIGLWVYGPVCLVLGLYILKYTSIFKHLWECITLQYTYEREYGEEYLVSFAGIHSSFVRNPLERLGLVKGYSNKGLDYPDDM